MFEGTVQKNNPFGDGTMTYQNGEVYTGNWEKGLKDGYGVMIYPQSDIRIDYTGFWKINLFHGTGSMNWKNGENFEGLFANGERSGYGVHKYSRNDKLQRDFYKGDWKGDEPSGKGTLTWNDGRKLEGFWSYGKANGHSKFFFANGNIYEGQYVDGEMTGFGKLTYSENDLQQREYYLGEFRNGLSEGNGTIVGRHGHILVGIFKDDNINFGKYSFPNGIVYTGQFKEGLKSVDGEMVYSQNDEYNRQYYKGQWQDDKRVGKGTLVWKNGQQYHGNWKEDDFNGFGKYILQNGNVYQGEFKDGKFHGSGQVNSPNGELLQKGLWEENEFVGQTPERGK